MRRAGRRILLLTSAAGLAACIGLLFVTQSVLLAYAGLAFLVATTGAYLLPEEHPDRALIFPRTHPYFRFIRILDFASIPATFLLVLAGVLAAVSRMYWVLVFLAAVRIVPGLAIASVIHRRSTRLLSIPQTSFLEIEESGMCHVTGYVFETRMRRRRRNRVLYNVWLVDPRGDSTFIPGMREIRGTTERVSEGARCSVVGPSTVAFGVRAIQPIVSVVPPANWEGSDSDWHEVIWRRTRIQRLTAAATGSVVYVMAILIMGMLASMLTGRTSLIPAATLSGLAATFFGALTEKNYRESNSYEIGSYFEPRWTGLPPEVRRRRLEVMGRKAEIGKVPREYVAMLELMERRLGRS